VLERDLRRLCRQSNVFWDPARWAKQERVATDCRSSSPGVILLTPPASTCSGETELQLFVRDDRDGPLWFSARAKAISRIRGLC
jgi:hypothetical protein